MYLWTLLFLAVIAVTPINCEDKPKDKCKKENEYCSPDSHSCCTDGPDLECTHIHEGKVNSNALNYHCTIYAADKCFKLGEKCDSYTTCCRGTSCWSSSEGKGDVCMNRKAVGESCGKLDFCRPWGTACISEKCAWVRSNCVGKNEKFTEDKPCCSDYTTKDLPFTGDLEDVPKTTPPSKSPQTCPCSKEDMGCGKDEDCCDKAFSCVEKKGEKGEAVAKYCEKKI